MSRVRALVLVVVGTLAAGGALAAVGALAATSARHPRVLLVGTYKGIRGQYKSIQTAVRAAKAGDWILVGPGDYKEQGYKGMPEPAGVLITTPNIHLRGMNRNSVVIDGTKRGAPKCSSRAKDQGKLNRNGIEVFKANGTWIQNLTVCNFLNNGKEGEQIWWNGGDGTGHIDLHGYWGNYLTATSSYSSTVAGKLGPCCGIHYPAADYGIFTSNTDGGWFKHSYASNMADAAFYIGACQQVCNQVMQYDWGQYSALCLSSTNAGGYLLIKNNLCSDNKTGLVSNSQNNDDFPSPQNGMCPSGRTGALGTKSCTVWLDNTITNNNNPNVPGNGVGGLAGGAPVGTGLIVAGSRYLTLAGNTVTHNGAWGELIADLPDQETPPPQDPHPCQGGTQLPGQICLYPAIGNVSENNRFRGNGFFGNPTNGDIGDATTLHSPGQCFTGDSTPDGTDPPGIETNPLYQPSNGMCTQANAGDYTVLAGEAECGGQLLAPCPSGPFATNYPHPSSQFKLHGLPKTLATMPNPCVGVPANPWCAAYAAAHRIRHEPKAPRIRVNPGFTG